MEMNYRSRDISAALPDVLEDEIEQLRQRVQELEKERDEIAIEARRKQRNWISVCEERDQMKVYCAQAERRANDMAEERDKATQYWQIAEGRCDALMKQIDELLAASCAVVERWDSPLWKDLPHTGEYIHRLREAIASVKEKA